MHDDNSSASSDMFSPPTGRRASLHQNTPEQPPTGNNNAIDTTLPALQDNSWIGARVSPIPSFDNDDDGDATDIAATAPYRRALHDSLEAGGRLYYASERTALLGGDNNKQQQHNNRSSIHPLWDLPDNDDNIPLKGGNSRRLWHNYGVVAISGFWLSMMGLHDLYLGYIAMRRGVDPLYPVGWLSLSFPFLGPSARTLSRFGAFIPAKLILSREVWRFVSALFLSTSVVEFMVVLWAWSFLRRAGIAPSILGIYLLAALTGEIWMVAFNPHGISGAVPFGTCGVLCAVGMHKPPIRFQLFLTSIVFIVLGLLSPTSSSIGAIGGSFMGWALSGFSMTFRSRQIVWQSLSTIAAIVLWVIPIVYYSVWGASLQENQV